MPDQPNRSWFQYTDDRARTWAIQADTTWGANADSGLAAFDSADPPFGPQSRTHHVRKVIYRDPTTFRTRVLPVGTPAAFAALPATLDAVIHGSATAVTYNLAGTIPEKLRIASTSRHDTDHA